MLRGMMPEEVGSVINSALGAGGLEIRWVQMWFDWFFLGSVLLTVAGIAVGRVFGGWDEDWDEARELGKRV